VAETKRLGAKGILIGECGHASRAAKVFVPTFAPEGEAPPVTNIMELAHRLIAEGRVKLNPDVVTETVTYHDPCNIARSGWLVERPREILRSFVRNFVEMTPSGRENYCCGGGGGTVSIDEIHDYRVGVTGKRKADQLRETGAEIVVAPCANCKKQLSEVIRYFELPCEVQGLHNLILRAIRFE